jgi:two-component system nitrate/nitrite response regulator NarL
LPIEVPKARDRILSVLVADAQSLFRDAVARAIRQCPDLRLVGEVEDARAVLDAVVALRPDVAVLALPLPPLAGERLVRAIARDGSATRSVVILPSADPDVSYRSLGSGAAACVTRSVGSRELCRAVRAAACGETVLGDDVQTELARDIRMRYRAGGPFTARERQVLALLAEGLSTAGIARRLHLAETTIKTNLKTLYDKLGVSGRAAAVAAGMRRGLLD